MKRPTPTFVVEVRRQRRSANSNGKAWLAEPAQAGALAGSERHPGAAALFEAERKASSPAKAPPSRPQGRILPSLADVEPTAPRFEEAEAPQRRKRESLGATRKLKSETKTEPGRELAPPVRSPDAPMREVRAVRALKARSQTAKSKSKVTKAEPVVTPLAARTVAAAQPAAIPEAPPDEAAVERAGARLARHRRILERYVLGSAPKPGERWKRRTQKAGK